MGWEQLMGRNRGEESCRGGIVWEPELLFKNWGTSLIQKEQSVFSFCLTIDFLNLVPTLKFIYLQYLFALYRGQALGFNESIGNLTDPNDKRLFF